MQRVDSSPSKDVEIIELPYLPARIDISDIKDWVIDPITNKLVMFWHTAAERQRLLTKYKNVADDRYKENKFDVIVHEGRAYALYEGVQKGKEAGVGSFGIVKYAIDLENGVLYAVKIFSTTHKNDINKPPTQRNIQSIMRMVNEEFTELKKSDLIHGKRPPQFRVTQKKGAQAYYFMRLVSGIDMINYASFHKLSPRKWLMLARNICKLVDDFHKSGKLHCDIKLENIIIDPATEKLTLIDYSFVKNLPKNPDGKLLGEKCGTPSYAAPEIKNKGVFSKKSEIYAAGVCIAKMLRISRTNPQDHSTSLVARGTPNSFIQGDQAFIDRIIMLCESMMQQSPERRPTLPQLMIAIPLLERSVKQPISITMIDAKQLVTLDKIQLDLLCAKLKEQDEVQIINSDPTINLGSVLSIMHRFQQSNINIKRSIYNGMDANKVIEKLKLDIEGRYPNIPKDIKLLDVTTIPIQSLYKQAFLVKDIEHIKKYLQQGAKPDALDFLLAVSIKNLPLVELLLAHNVDPNVTNEFAPLPLLQTCRNDFDSRFMQALLVKADPNFTLPNCNTPLIQAIHYYLEAKKAGANPTIEKIMMLLINGALPNLAAKDTLPLHEAIKGGDEELVKLLIVMGANPDYIDYYGRNALQVAIDEKQTHIYQLLLEATEPTPTPAISVGQTGLLGSRNAKRKLEEDRNESDSDLISSLAKRSPNSKS